MTFSALIEELGKEPFVFIQTHNFPDHDAVASAFALQCLFAHFGITGRIVYDGDIQRDSLLQMTEELGIDIRHWSAHEMTPSHRIVIVDGCKWNKNVTDLPGYEIAVIDHHLVEHPEDVPYADIRSGYGACSSILYSYFVEHNVEIPRNAATAMMIGINMDTALLTRGVSKDDIEAYANLYGISDIRLQNSILRNFIQTKDLSFYRHVIDNVKIGGGIAWCYFMDGCNQNLLAILGDFLLALEEVEFVVLCAKNGDNVNFSIRNEKKEWNAALVIQEALKGMGFGGGHQDMAGGMVNGAESFDADAILAKIKGILARARQPQSR